MNLPAGRVQPEAEVHLLLIQKIGLIEATDMVEGLAADGERRTQ